MSRGAQSLAPADAPRHHRQAGQCLTNQPGIKLTNAINYSAHLTAPADAQRIRLPEASPAPRLTLTCSVNCTKCIALLLLARSAPAESAAVAGCKPWLGAAATTYIRRAAALNAAKQFCQATQAQHQNARNLQQPMPAHASLAVHGAASRYSADTAHIAALPSAPHHALRAGK